MSGVSVILPAWNEAVYIVTALESLLAQSVPDWEAIVVDDGSSDDTLSIARRFAERDARFRVLSQAHQGVSAARNAGIQQARLNWLLFLNADDWILPQFLEKITGLLDADPTLEAAYCRGAMQFPDGTQVLCEYSPASADMFPIFARARAFPIHACIVSRSRVLSAGGFDPSLLTCEDWDLWQRIARAGARFGSLNEALACCRGRPASAFINSLQLLRDGLGIIERGHSVDPRFQTEHATWAAGIPVGNLVKNQFHFACWPAGLALGSGQETEFLLKEFPDAQDPGLEPETIAKTLFLTVLLPQCRKKADWPLLWPVLQPRVQGFLQNLEERSLTPGLIRRVTTVLERLILENADLSERLALGLTAGVRVEISQPLVDLSFSESVERAYCQIEIEAETLGTIDLPAFGGVVSRYVLADAIAAEFAWNILGHFFEATIYGGLLVECGQMGLSVLRGNFLLAERLSPDEKDNWAALHDQIGWLVFLQELWGRPDWDSEHFYEDLEFQEPTLVREFDKDTLEVEITDDFVDIRTSRDALQVIYSVGGVAIGSVQIPVQSNLLRASQIRAAINVSAGFELCRAAVREGILGKPFSEPGSLRARLTAATAAGNHQDYKGLIIGRRVPSMLGASHSRRAVLPTAAALELVEAARAAGEIVLQLPTEGQAPANIIYAPEFVSHPDHDKANLLAKEPIFSMDCPTNAYLRDHFESIFSARDDPWKYTSDYERVKYEQTLSLLPSSQVGRTLEIGCAEGHFTLRLAPLVDQLVAGDISEVALKRASERCAGFNNIRYVQFDLTKDPLPGAFNLIVCSEILYYAGDRETLKAVIQKILKSLNPGGYFLTAHAHLVIDEPDRTGFDWDHPFGAKVISDEIASSGLQLRKEIRTPLYRVQLFQLAEHPSTAELLNAPDITILESQPAPLLPQVAAHVHWHGVETRPDFQPRPVTTNRLPILMYHRVAPKGSSRLADYLVTPEGFREQLRYLSEAGYYSLTLDAWCAARELRKPLPGKPVMLTFDDGYADFPDFAWPILKQYGFTCTVFLVSNEIGKTNLWDTFYGDDISLLDWPDILLLQKQGIEFGSHSTTHAHLDGISLPEVVQEAALSRKNLSEKLGKPVHAFTYPYGSTDRVIQHLVGACGYVYGLTVVQRPCTFADSLLALPRIEVSGSDDLQRFIRKLHL